MNIRILLFIILLPTFSDRTLSQTWREWYHKADSLYNLSSISEIHKSAGYVRQALEAVEQESGDSAMNVAMVLDLCAEIVCEVEDQYKEAYVYAERSLAFKERLLGPSHPEVAKTLDLLAGLSKLAGRSTVVKPMRARVLSIYETSHAAESRDYASALHNMAVSYQSEGQFDSAAILFTRALEMMRRVLLPNDRTFAYTLTMFAVNYMNQGFYSEAEELMKAALKNWSDFYGPESGMAAICMGNLAGLYSIQGKHELAESLERKSLECRRKEFGNDFVLGRGYYGLGSVLKQEGKYSEAIDTLKRALEIWDNAGAVESRSIAVTRLIGECYFAQEDYGQAKLYFQRALSIQDSLIPTAIQEKTTTLLQMARTLVRTGEFGTADSLFAYALSSREEFYGSTNPDVAEVMEAYAQYHRQLGEYSKGSAMSHRAVAIRSQNFLRNARMMSEKDALTYSVFLRRSVSNYLSTTIDAGVFDTVTASQAVDMILSTKSQTAEQAVLRRRALVTETDSTTLVLAENYRHTRFQLSSLYVEGPGRESPEQYRRDIDSLENLSNELEASLARRSASFAATQQARNISVDEIAAHLPPSSTLVEFLRFNYVQLKPDTVIPRYIALTINASGNTGIIDLGGADRIDKTIEAYRDHFSALASSRKPLGKKEVMNYKELSSRLYSMIWKPLEHSITQPGTLFIAPDGGLNMVSFAGLTGGDGKYLIEKHAIQYLSAGRDLTRRDDRSTSATGLLALGDPDFTATVAERISAAPQLAANISASNPYQLRNVRSGCEMLNEMSVSRLYTTRTEVESIADFWSRLGVGEHAEALTGSKASEERFKQESAGRRVIHLATHGYFLHSSCMTTANDNAGGGENPLLQSGLLLAGANLHGEGAREAGAEDGIVTALEVSAMDLRGTDLVVLSACETGLGRVEQGEGVYGLRRAFQMAGAKTVVSSLWKVPDKETMQFMRTLYSTKAKTYPELMQQVALQRIRELRLRDRSSHPFTWGAFIATGDWMIH